MDYIIKYTKVPHKNEYKVFCSNGFKYTFYNEGLKGSCYLLFHGVPNDFLFHKFQVDKRDLYYKVFKRHENGTGVWPYCKTKKECMMLLKALIRETQIRYYADTEI